MFLNLPREGEKEREKKEKEKEKGKKKLPWQPRFE